MNLTSDISTLKVARVKCLQSLLFFTRYMFKHKQRRKFVVGDHHEQICEALEKVYRGEITRLIINVAPRYGKTELAVKNFIAHGLAHNPAAKFIHLSYSDTLALDNSEEVKDLIQEDYYQELFPNVQIKADSQAKKKWYTTAGGGVYATAAGGQVTGFGAGRVDEEEDLEEFLPFGEKGMFGGAIVIDDPIKPEDADSDVIRNRVNQRFDSTIRNRVNSRKTPIVVIMQRLHEEDLSGYLMREGEADEWTVLSLPCIKEDGTALWPFKHTIEELKALEAANEQVFERQYLQSTRPLKGRLFPEPMLKFYDPAQTDLSPEAVEFSFMAMDAADKGGDYYAAPVCLLVGNAVYIPEVIFSKDGTDVTEPETVALAVKYGINAARFEGNGGWAVMGKNIRKVLETKLPDCDFRIISNTVSKHTRIQERAAFIRRNFYFRRDYKDIPQYAAFMKNLMGYLKEGNNANDDAPDVTAGAAKYFHKHHPEHFEAVQGDE